MADVTLADVEWGDVVAELDGVLVVEGTIEVDGDERQVLVKRFADTSEIADAANHLLLAQLGVDVFTVHGHGPGWLVLDHPSETWGWRLAEASDALDDRFAQAVAAWGASLEAAHLDELDDGRHLRLVTPEWPLWALTQDLSSARPIDLRGLGVVQG